jgi:hypothetical protein
VARISDLQLRYLDRNAGASEGTPVQYTCTSAGTVRTAIASSLSGLSPANMSGALVRWDVGSNANSHQWGAVYSYDNGSTTLTFDSDLPNATASSDKFTLISGGRWLTDQRIPGLLFGGNWPPSTTGLNLTGMIMDYIAMLNGAGNGTLTYTASNGTAQWTPPGGTIGTAVTITGLSLGDQVTLAGGGVAIEEKSKFVILERNASALPVGNTSDTLALTIPKNVHMMALTGLETLGGITIYRPVGIINTHATDTIYAVRAFVPNPFSTAAQTTLTAGIGVGADTLQLTSATNWPVHCWVAKVDVNGQVVDCRYCYDRSGNTMTVMNPAGGMRGFSATTWNTSDNVVPMPWQDIALNAPTVSEFANPATEQTVPSGTAWVQPAAVPMNVNYALLAGDVAAGAIYTIWERFVIPANMRPASSIVADLRVYAEVDEE